MTREEKQILEMKRDIAEFWANGDFDKVVEEFINLGYRKINNNEVVISKEEKQKLLKEMYEQGKFDALADLEKEGKVVISKEEFWKLSNKFSKKELDDISQFRVNKACKETAEKILKGLYCLAHEYHENEIEELAKQYGVDLGEEK